MFLTIQVFSVFSCDFCSCPCFLQKLSSIRLASSFFANTKIFQKILFLLLHQKFTISSVLSAYFFNILLQKFSSDINIHNIQYNKQSVILNAGKLPNHAVRPILKLVKIERVDPLLIHYFSIFPVTNPYAFPFICFANNRCHLNTCPTLEGQRPQL